MFRCNFLLLVVDGFIPVCAVWRWLKWVMRQDHRIVEHEGSLLVSLDEVECEVIYQGWAILTIRKIPFDAIVLQARICITRRPPRMLPKARLIETEMLWRIDLVPKLPLTTNRSRVAGLLH